LGDFAQQVVMGWVGAEEVLVLASDTKVMVALLVYVLYTSCMYPLTLWCMANAGPTLFTLIKTMQVFSWRACWFAAGHDPQNRLRFQLYEYHAVSDATN
jgi:hypothetical protein